MSIRRSRPFPFARTVVSLTALTMFGAFAAEALLPDGRPAYAIVNAAVISEKPTSLGIADSDLYFSTPEQINTTLDKMASLGVTNVRVLIPWYDVNPDPGVYDWSKIDAVMRAASARDMGVLAVITHSPDWAVTPGDTPVISPPADVADFGDFTALVAQRYKGQISAYEIWNEPNGAVSFYPSPNPAKYTALLKDAYAKIKAIDPSVTVIAGVLGAVPTNATDGTVDSPTFLEQMYAAGAQGSFDAISFHPYQYSTPYSLGPDLNGSPFNEVVAMHALMVSQGDAAKLIWASEYGLPTSVVSEQQQADYIADFLASWSTQGYAGPMFVYTTRDASGAFETDAKFGVFREDWTPKPAAQIIADYIAAHPEVVPPTTPTPTFIELIVRTVTQFAHGVVMTIRQFITTVVAAIAAVFTPPAPPTTAARLAVSSPSSATSIDSTSSTAAAPTTAETIGSPVTTAATSTPTTTTRTAAPSTPADATPTDTTPAGTTPAASTTSPDTTSDAVATVVAVG